MIITGMEKMVQVETVMTGGAGRYETCGGGNVMTSDTHEVR